jgi:hypothetical protein
VSRFSDLLAIVGEWQKAHEAAERAIDAWFAAQPGTRRRRLARARILRFRREQRECEASLIRLAKSAARQLDKGESDVRAAPAP